MAPTPRVEPECVRHVALAFTSCPFRDADTVQLLSRQTIHVDRLIRFWQIHRGSLPLSVLSYLSGTRCLINPLHVWKFIGCQWCGWYTKCNWDSFSDFPFPSVHQFNYVTIFVCEIEILCKIYYFSCYKEGWLERWWLLKRKGIWIINRYGWSWNTTNV